MSARTTPAALLILLSIAPAAAHGFRNRGIGCLDASPNLCNPKDVIQRQMGELRLGMPIRAARHEVPTLRRVDCSGLGFHDVVWQGCVQAGCDVLTCYHDDGRQGHPGYDIAAWNGKVSIIGYYPVDDDLMTRSELLSFAKGLAKYVGGYRAAVQELAGEQATERRYVRKYGDARQELAWLRSHYGQGRVESDPGVALEWYTWMDTWSRVVAQFDPAGGSPLYFELDDRTADRAMIQEAGQ